MKKILLVKCSYEERATIIRNALYSENIGCVKIKMIIDIIENHCDSASFTERLACFKRSCVDVNVDKESGEWQDGVLYPPVNKSKITWTTGSNHVVEINMVVKGWNKTNNIETEIIFSVGEDDSTDFYPKIIQNLCSAENMKQDIGSGAMMYIITPKTEEEKKEYFEPNAQKDYLSFLTEISSYDYNFKKL